MNDMDIKSGGTVYWLSSLGDYFLQDFQDSEWRVLLFPTQASAIAAGIAEHGSECAKDICAIPAVVQQMGRGDKS